MTFENKVSNWKRALKPQLLRQLEHKTHFVLPAHAWSQPCYKYYYNYSFKIFRRLWLAQIKPPVNSSKAIGVDQIWNCNIPSIRRYICLETRSIHGIFAWKRGCLSNRLSINLPSASAFLFINEWTKKMAFTAVQRQITQNIAGWTFLLFRDYL